MKPHPCPAANTSGLPRAAAGKRLAVSAVAAVLSLTLFPAAGTAAVRLALIEGGEEALTMQLAQPIERVLREAGPGAELLAADEAACVFGGGEYRLSLPPGVNLPAAASGAPAAALESDAEVLFVYPPDASLTDALRKAAADSSTFRMADSVLLSVAKAVLSVEKGGNGADSLLLRAELAHQVSGRRRKGLAAYYRIRWKNAPFILIVVGRAYGGLGRLAAAAAMEKNYGLIGVARGGTFGGSGSELRGRALVETLERAGLAYAAVADAEIDNWRGLEAYLRERPGGIKYLSANLVYSSAPARTPLPPYAVFSSSGVRVALVGLTPERAGRVLAASGLKDLEISDPVAAVKTLLPRLRGEVDVVVVLSALAAADNARLAEATRGIDLILADDAPFLTFTPPPTSIVVEKGRPAFANPFPPVRAYWPALNIVELEFTPAVTGADWRVIQKAVLLDDSIAPAAGFAELELKPFSAESSSGTALFPAARDVFPDRARTGIPIYEARDFWTLAAAALAEEAGAEAGLLAVQPLANSTVGAVRETLARQWLSFPDTAVLASIPGSMLNSLAEEAAGQKARVDAGLPPEGRFDFVVSGFDTEKRLVRGIPFDPNDYYLVSTSGNAAKMLHLPGPYRVLIGTPTVAAAALEGLRAASGTPGGTNWRGWMSGGSVSEPGLWKVNFRDISLNIRQTRVSRSDRFDVVPNSRIHGMDEFMLGGTLKADADYQRKDYKLTNTLDLEYAKDRLAPRGAPATTNLIANRYMFLMLGTRRAGEVPYRWLASSWGPSLGVQTDGEFQSMSGLKRKQTYSLFPGVELYGGSVVETLSLTSNFTRDLSREHPNTQTGLRARALVSLPAGPSGARLNAEVWNNFFFRAHNDDPSDLRCEGQATAKVSVPLSKSLMLSPFVDLYWLQLKVRPVWGYSLMTGISIGFSRLWKPQYEHF